MPDVHAVLSASSSKQWLHCPPSIRLQENFPNESSVYDKFILTLIDTAQRLVMDVGRMNENQLAEHEETSRQAMLYTVSYLYENRNTADYHALTLTLRSLLFAQREGVV